MSDVTHFQPLDRSGGMLRTGVCDASLSGSAAGDEVDPQKFIRERDFHR
jgi:hypothetical protein